MPQKIKVTNIKNQPVKNNQIAQNIQDTNSVHNNANNMNNPQKFQVTSIKNHPLNNKSQSIPSQNTPQQSNNPQPKQKINSFYKQNNNHQIQSSQNTTRSQVHHSANKQMSKMQINTLKIHTNIRTQPNHHQSIHNHQSQQTIPLNENLVSILDAHLRSDNLNILNHINKTPSDVYISLTTIPPRLLSNEFENVINSLINQVVKPKNIIVNICKQYRRDFQIEFNAIEERINFLKSKYTSLVFNISEDYGPITKIIGLVHLTDITINEDDIVVVVDDDWMMNSMMTFYYRYVYQLYTCDCVMINERDIINQSAGQFIDTNILFYDNYHNFIFGWLSFSFRFKFVRRLLDFYRENLHLDDWFWKHDDLIITLFYKKLGLYACGINMYFNNSFIDGRLQIEENGALRMEHDTYHKRINLERKLLDIFGYSYYFKNESLYLNYQNNNARYEIPFYARQRDYLFNLDNIAYNPTENDFHNKQIDFKYFDNHIVAVTIVFFNTNSNSNQLISYNMPGKNKQMVLHQNNYSKKITYLLRTEDLCSLVLHSPKSYKILQTAEDKFASHNKFLSVNTILSYLPDVEYTFFDNEKRIHYIANYFQNDLQYYNKLIPGAYRSDFFRALYLYREGGLYLDCKNTLYGNIRLLENPTINEMFCRDVGEGYVCNGFIFIRDPGNDIIKKYIDEMIENIGNSRYGENALSVTGPKVLGHNVTRNKHLYNNVPNSDWKKSYLAYDENNMIIIKNSYDGYYEENNYINNTYYDVYWKNRNVFR
jgi:mannosyltransferase OCH1-like enzyme